MNFKLEQIKLQNEKAILTEAQSGQYSDLELLETKIALNNAIMAVDEYFTEGTIEKVKKHLKKNWKKYALGAAAIGAAYGGKKAYDNRDAIKQKAGEAADYMKAKANDVADFAEDKYNQVTMSDGDYKTYKGVRKIAGKSTKTYRDSRDDMVTAMGNKKVSQADNKGYTKPTESVSKMLSDEKKQAAQKQEADIEKKRLAEIDRKAEANAEEYRLKEIDQKAQKEASRFAGQELMDKIAKQKAKLAQDARDRNK